MSYDSNIWNPNISLREIHFFLPFGGRGRLFTYVGVTMILEISSPALKGFFEALSEYHDLPMLLVVLAVQRLELSERVKNALLYPTDLSACLSEPVFLTVSIGLLDTTAWRFVVARPHLTNVLTDLCLNLSEDGPRLDGNDYTPLHHLISLPSLPRSVANVGIH